MAPELPRQATQATNEAMLEFLAARRSVGKVLPDRPPRAVIERLLEAACTAPNHHQTQPWRFLVLAGAAREQIGAVLEAALRDRLPETSSPAAQALLAKERGKLLRAPVVIVVAVHPSTAAGVVRQEEIASGVIAAYNILLAAQALGLGAMWRTGDTAYDQRVLEALGFGPGDEIVGFVYVGYPDPAQAPPPRPPRAPASTRTRWTGWED